MVKHNVSNRGWKFNDSLYELLRLELLSLLGLDIMITYANKATANCRIK